MSPSPLFARHRDWFGHETELKVLDVACGSGRNGQWFLAQGHRVCFVDINLDNLPDGIRLHPKAECVQQNLESSPVLAANEYDLVMVFNYLHRPLMPQLMTAVRPGGLLVYETFTQRQASIGRPKNPNFLLTDNELKQYFTHWQQLYYGEDSPETCPDSPAHKARIICRKPLED